jgi:hypothetical protein
MVVKRGKDEAPNESEKFHSRQEARVPTIRFHRRAQFVDEPCFARAPAPCDDTTLEDARISNEVLELRRLRFASDEPRGSGEG